MAILYKTATEWIDKIRSTGYLNSTDWDLPPNFQSLSDFAAHLGLAPGDSRIQYTAKTGLFQDLQPFYYWGCQRTQPGLVEQPCKESAPPNPKGDAMQWTFNFDDGFTGTALQTQQFFVMVYFPVPGSK